MPISSGLALLCYSFGSNVKLYPSFSNTFTRSQAVNDKFVEYLTKNLCFIAPFVADFWNDVIFDESEFI